MTDADIYYRELVKAYLNAEKCGNGNSHLFFSVGVAYGPDEGVPPELV